MAPRFSRRGAESVSSARSGRSTKLAFNWDISRYDVIDRHNPSFGSAGTHGFSAAITMTALFKRREDPIPAIACCEEARPLGDLLKQEWKPNAPLFIAAGTGRDHSFWDRRNGRVSAGNELRTARGPSTLMGRRNVRGYLLQAQGSHSLENRERRGLDNHGPRRKTSPCESAAQVRRVLCEESYDRRPDDRKDARSRR